MHLNLLCMSNSQQVSHFGNLNCLVLLFNKEKEIFTRQELKVLCLAIDRKSNKEIGDILFISIYTVKRHKANIADKLHIKGSKAFQDFLWDTAKMVLEYHKIDTKVSILHL